MSQFAQYGIVGLGVMGRNIAWNLHGQNFPVSTYSISQKECSQVRTETPDLPIADSLAEMVASLTRPRTVFLMVTAGEPVDQVLDELLPLLASGDVVMDGGNSFYRDTERRLALCKEVGIDYLGVGVSGGKIGARDGASVMVGGNQDCYLDRQPLFQALACKFEGDSCCGYMGGGGAGHFVKMAHNGIEYAVMQLLAEAYDFMRRGLNLPPAEIRDWFESQLGGPLDSYLLEITVSILAKGDDFAGGLLLDKVVDKAGQKGTGQWSSIAALEYGVPTPTILAAVTERALSGLSTLRESYAKQFVTGPAMDGDRWQVDLQQALAGGMLAAFTQGLHLIKVASETNDWHTDVLAAVRVWRGGCIIRASLLDDILVEADNLRAGLPLVMAPAMQRRIAGYADGWRRTMSSSVLCGVPMPAMAASLNYVDSLRSARLPTALIQAQRDCFGAHSFERTDRPGSFHVDWLQSTS